MKLDKSLVLIGMMGSGKTTIGREISKKLKIKFVDTDHEIEKKEKMSINEIFKKKGEKYFRQLEEKMTLEIVNQKLSVISIGGGGFVNKKIQKAVLNKCISYWLNWDNNSLINRLKNNKNRPILKDLNESQIIELISNRAKIYEKANYEIICENLSRKEIVTKIIKNYENK